MGQFVGCTEGMRDACEALDFPVVSGNVSLYNETEGEAILPTPVIGGVGLIEDLERRADLAFKAGGEAILLIGETAGHLGSSAYLAVVEGREEGPPPPVDLAAERCNGDFVRGLILEGRVSACHDLSDGGLLVALAEMAMAGRLGARIAPPEGLDPPLHAWLFGEDQARYIVTAPEAPPLLEAARAAGVPAVEIGVTGGDTLTLPGGGTISVSEMAARHEGWLPGYMGEGH
jgi:phosphoribosylformylglycinamidine synthase